MTTLSPILSAEQLEELTHLKQPKAQKRWLDRAGIRCRVRNDGTIFTTWEAVNAPLVQSDRTRPNLAAVRKAG